MFYYRVWLAPNNDRRLTDPECVIVAIFPPDVVGVAGVLQQLTNELPEKATVYNKADILELVNKHGCNLKSVLDCVKCFMHKTPLYLSTRK